ncbi:MAG: CZB domain-containing protein [Sulfurimonas sp.]|jgi:hypothetical protein|nr:CZB domain-containing protein [Sulfurimonas sp.]
MDKTKTLESIQNARRAHEAQMSKIKATIDGDKVNNPTAVAKTKCAFGKWLYDDENHLRDILGSLFYDKIEVLHAKWHNEYFKLFEIFFKEQKKGFFTKIFGSAKITEMEVDRAKLYYSELEVTTQELLKALGSSERRISALPESKFYWRENV